MFSRPVYSLWRCCRSISNVHHQQQALSPAVRALVDKNHLNASKIMPTGPKGRLLKGDVLDYINQHGSSSRDSTVTPTTIVHWRTPPTVGEMWSQLSDSEHLVPRGFAQMNIRTSKPVLDEQLEAMVVKATTLASKEMSQNSLNISVVMATGGSVTASVISSEMVTMEIPLNDISTLISQHQQQWNNATHQSISPSICICTTPGHLTFIDLTTLVMPTSSMLLFARLQDKNDHMISVAVSHDLRFINQSETEQWLQAFQNVLHKL